ncbi:hypothetical protein FSP39_020702 [Pinctada imbricata]|uniref:Uncharacterized protein n=1 Tax=Pinctada imbricata TaxID=66713 RepID=A0AA88YS32_PINIB|nr:hypothetical protein FSP39_020702 [Pinctada imbricata]
METLEIDVGLLGPKSNEISRRTFVDLLNFRNQKYLKTKFHENFINYLKEIKDSTMRDFSVSGIQGIGKSFTLLYFMLSCLGKSDYSVHYIDLQTPGFKIEQFWDYAKRMKDEDLLIIDHVTLFNVHYANEIRKERKKLILTVETGFTASASLKNIIFGKEYQLDEEEFNQMWIAQQKGPKLREEGKNVYKLCAEEALMTPRLLHVFSFKMQFEGASLLQAFSKFRVQQRNQIEVFLTSEVPVNQLYNNFLLRSRLLLYIIQRDGDIILTKSQFDVLRIAINIFTFEQAIVTKDHLTEDSRFTERGLAENDLYYRVTHLVPSLAVFWKERLPYRFQLVLESVDCNDLINIMFQCGGERKEIENMLVAVQKEHYYVVVPDRDVYTTTYEEAEENTLVPQVDQKHVRLDEVYSVNSDDLQSFDTPFTGHRKNVARCAMWIQQKLRNNRKENFIIHPDIANLMGVDYFCKIGSIRKMEDRKQMKCEECLFIVQVATGASHNGKTVGEALDTVKGVLAGEDLTIHVVIIIVVESLLHPYRLNKCKMQDVSAINLAAKNFIENLSDSKMLHQFIMKVKSDEGPMSSYR